MPSTADWYAVADMPPPYTIDVRVQWGARMFKARRGRHPQTGGDIWAAVKAGGQLEVIAAIGKEAAPEFWQPLNPEKWVAALPSPIRPASAEGRMVTERQRFGAVESASSEELAREMEADRDAARTGVSHLFHGEQAGRPWFYDATGLKYEPAGEVTLKHCEWRLLRAITFSGAGKRFGVRMPLSTKALAEMADAIARGWQGSDDDVSHRLKALPADIKDFTIAMAWFTKLNPIEFWKERRQPFEFNRPQKVIVARALPVPPTFGDIAAEYIKGGTEKDAKAIYDKAIRQCLAAANGQRVHQQPVVDQIAALRERNRAHRRGGV